MIQLRLVRLTIFATEERRVINFAEGLNVVVGPYSSGKTSLLELVKYSLGGSARLSEAVKTGVTSIVLEAALQGRVLAFERDIGSNRVRVSQGGDPFAVLHATASNAKGTVLASRFLLDELGLPAMRVRRSRSAASAARESISFWDLYRYAYVSQSDMGQSIAGHSDSQLDRKRKRAFELMFGLLDPKSAELETTEADRVAEIEVEEKRLRDVTAFLEATGVPARAQALALLDQAESRRAGAVSQLDELRSQSRARSVDLDPERDGVGHLHARVAELDAAANSLRFEIATRRRLAAQLELEIETLGRSESVSDILGPIDFASCPRCLQAVRVDRASSTHCYLCMQELAEGDSDASGALRQAEGERLRAVLNETRELLFEDETALRILDAELGAARVELHRAEERLRAKTDAYVAPLFEEISAISAVIAAAEAETRRLNFALAQWTERAAIQTSVERLTRELARVRQELADERARLEHRRSFVVEFSGTFDEIIRELELAWYTTAKIDVTTYLPVIGAGDYESLSGGQRTVVSVAYHLALLTTGLVHPLELQVPSLLILDTPSKYLGTKDAEQVARDYRRVAAIVDAYEIPVQIVVADNDPPPVGLRPANTVELSYEQPLVPGYEHPGPDAAQPIHDPYDDEE